MIIEQIIEHTITIRPLYVLYIAFGMFIAHEKLGASYYIKRAFRIKPTKKVKLLDCYPCQGFWLALIITLGNLPSAMAVYLILILIDRK